MKKIYYSQFGEDRYLDEKCSLPEKGIFVDVGAGGTDNSNSLFFEEKGWKVLCIEPDVRHEGLSKRNLVDHSVIGDIEGEAEFVFHRFPQLSGLYHDKETAVKLPMHKLDTVLNKYNVEKIDVLSVDVEGNEVNVIKGFSVEKYCPSYIVIEHSNQFKKNKEAETKSLLEGYGYEVVYRTQSNLIMKRKDHHDR